MVYDADYREISVTALETATQMTAQGAATPGAFIVPTTCSRITELRFVTNLNCADDTAFGWTSSFHFYGGGLKELTEGWFPGPVGCVEGIAAASGSKVDSAVQRYFTNIPVNPGGQFNVDAFMLGEDVGALHCMAHVVYDGPVVGKIVDMDQRNIDLTAANTLTTLTERGPATVEGDMRPHRSVIGEIFVGAGAKITAAATTVVTCAFELSGGGLLYAGNYKFIAAQSWGLNSELSGNADISPLERYICQIPVKVGSPVRVQGQIIEGDCGTAFSNVGFAYY